MIPMGRSFKRTERKCRNGGPPKVTIVGRYGRADSRMLGMLVCPVSSRQLGQGCLAVDLQEIPMAGPWTEDEATQTRMLKNLKLRKFYNSLLMLYE